MKHPKNKIKTIKYIKISFIWYILFILLFSSNVNGQEPTLFGLHGTNEHYPEIGAKVLRFGANDYGIKTAIENNDSTLLNQLKYLDSLGYTTVFYLIHNEDTNVDIIKKTWQRIPEGMDSIEVFQYLDTFLRSAGPYIDWIQINQEPLGITPYDTSLYPLTEIFTWWRNLAQFIHVKRLENDNTLGHLKILSPSISCLIPGPNLSPVVDSVIGFGEEYCDAISLHIYPETTEQGRQVIQYYRSKTAHTLACSEFSQAMAGLYTGWLNDINTVWTDSGDPFYGLKNMEVIDSAYTMQMDSSDWKAFIATAPYTENFIPEMYAAMDSNCFAFACYACIWQYGQPMFDWAQLFATKTVIQFPFPNNPFYSEYVRLSSLINSGSYQCGCQTTEKQEFLVVENKEEINFFINPSLSRINLISNEYLENADLYIYNLKGVLVIQVENINGYFSSIDANYLSAGLYFIRLQSNKQIIGKSNFFWSPF